MKHLRVLATGNQVEMLRFELAKNPELWNQHTPRTSPERSPHHEVDDIWVRYNAFANYDPEQGGLDRMSEPHDGEWYPAYQKLPSLRGLIFGLLPLIEGERLGAVLITRIPAGKQVKPHFDTGWHAGYYDKFAVQVQGAPGQLFCFEGEEHETKTGDLYTFDNSVVHWVRNDSEIDRITLIICVRVNPPGRYLPAGRTEKCL